MKRHALFVGVDGYADRNIQDLHCAINDATELAGFFKHRAHFDRAEALPNPRTCDDVLERVHDLLDGLKGGDEFLFFFAGHGVKTQDGHRLVCAGDQLASVKRAWAGIPLERLKFETAGTFNRLFLLDACRTDVLATNRGVAGAMEEGTRDLILGPACQAGADAGSLTILCSCDDGECAGEILQFRHGLFSMAMLDLLDEESRCGRRVAVSDDFAYRQMPGKMRALAKKADMVFSQKPQKRGPPIVILDGIVPSSESSPSFTRLPSVSVLVLCPVCGKKNHPEDTFKCRECGRDNLCLRHQDETTFLCADCAAAKRRERAEREAAERRAREAAERKAREAALLNGTCLETGICRTITLPGGAEMEIIYCPPGEFMMGSPTTEEGRYGDEIQHRVRLTKGFWLGKYPVTQRQWRSVMRNNPSRFKGDDLPVESVSWDDCKDFIAKVNASLGCGACLPTEAEWEYACRAGTTTAYFWGNALNGDKANCDGNYPCGTKTKGPYLEKTSPVGRYAPNPWGFYDMHGNVWEWCADWHGDYSGDAVDPTGPSSGESRVLRGGGWVNYARHCRSAFCFWFVPDNRNYGNGFRLCCSAGPRG